MTRTLLNAHPFYPPLHFSATPAGRSPSRRRRLRGPLRSGSSRRVLQDHVAEGVPPDGPFDHELPRPQLARLARRVEGVVGAEDDDRYVPDGRVGADAL